MIENVSVANDSLMINKGEGVTPSQPPSPSTSTAISTATTQKTGSGPAVEVAITEQLAQSLAQSDQVSTEKQQTQNLSNTQGKQSNDQEMEKKLKETIESLNEKLARLDREVLFKVDKRINRNYISVIDKKSKEIIREFPPEEIRAFIARFDEINQKLMVSSDVKSMIINLEV